MSHASDATPSDDRRPRPISEKKRAANRANAQRSTGPRSAEGKARASMNAMLYRETVGMVAASGGESPEQFIRFSKLIRADLRPQNFVQSLLVNRAVELLWKLRRAQAAQAAAVSNLVGHAVRMTEEDRKAGRYDEREGVMGYAEMALLEASETPAKEQGQYLRLELYADRLQRALMAVLLRLRQEQQRTGEGKPPRDREFHDRSVTRTVRSVLGQDYYEIHPQTDAEMLSEPTAVPGAPGPAPRPTPQAAEPCAGNAGRVDAVAPNPNSQNEPTATPPAACFKGSAGPSLN
jgi:hypothetical protein